MKRVNTGALYVIVGVLLGLMIDHISAVEPAWCFVLIPAAACLVAALALDNVP